MENLHSDLKKQLTNAIGNHKLSHAIILNGKSGYGTLALAHWVAKGLLCSPEDKKCTHKVDTLQHADYHFSYPFPKMKKNSISDDFGKEWKTFFTSQPFGTLIDWMDFLEAEKKQLFISVDESINIISKLNLRSYEGGKKIMLIWLAEHMNVSTANKLLKLIEEPPAQTHFILVTENADKMLPTILSRCQLVQVPRLSDEAVADILIKTYEVDEKKAHYIAHKSHGDVRLALQNLNHDTQDFEILLIDWVRNAFKAKKDASVLLQISDWSLELANYSREKQKQFIQFCIEVFRQALLENYAAGELVYQPLSLNNFKWGNFSKFVHSENISLIIEELNQAALQIERNGNSKIIFLDLGIHLIRFIHKKESHEIT